MCARLKLGMFDPPERVRYARIPYAVNDAPEHDRLARRVAQESIVLLKNDGRAAAAQGPGDARRRSARTPTTLDHAARQLPRHAVAAGHALAGIRSAVSPDTKVLYARGVDLVEGRQDPRAETAIDRVVPAPAPGS